MLTRYQEEISAISKKQFIRIIRYEKNVNIR